MLYNRNSRSSIALGDLSHSEFSMKHFNFVLRDPIWLCSLPDETCEELCQLFTGLTASLRFPACDSDSSSEGNIGVLRRLSPYLVTVGGRPMTTSNDEDDGLVHAFSPISQELNAAVVKTEQRLGRHFNHYKTAVKFKQQVTQLNDIFASFKTAVESVSQAIKVGIDMRYLLSYS